MHLHQMELKNYTLNKISNIELYIKFRSKLMVEIGNYNEVLRGYDIYDLYIKFREQMNKTGLTSLSDLSMLNIFLFSI